MDYQSFWNHKRYAVVGHTAVKPFPKITYSKLKELGKVVFPVDASIDDITGDKTFSAISQLPDDIDGIISEVPVDESLAVAKQAIERGISRVWFHQKCASEQAINYAKEHGAQVYHGTCAVMYLTSGFSLHSFHGWVNKKRGVY